MLLHHTAKSEQMLLNKKYGTRVLLKNVQFLKNFFLNYVILSRVIEGAVFLKCNSSINDINTLD